MTSDMCCTFYPPFLATHYHDFGNENVMWISGQSDDHNEVMIMSLSVSRPVYERRGRSTGSEFRT